MKKPTGWRKVAYWIAGLLVWGIGGLLVLAAVVFMALTIIWILLDIL